MSASQGPLIHDRQLLLHGDKRNQVLELDEIRQYGSDSFADADYVTIYGLRPDEWHARGVRLLGRTAVELTRDRLAERIGRDIAAAMHGLTRGTGALVIDLFAGSGNTLFWIVQQIAGARGVGFEFDDRVAALTARNLEIVGAPIAFRHCDYRGGLADLADCREGAIVLFVAPPWGKALDEAKGLDLASTEPPIGEIVDRVSAIFAGRKLLFAIQVYERVEPVSLAELQRRLDWSHLHVYDFNVPGRNHGILLGTGGWRPAEQ